MNNPSITDSWRLSAAIASGGTSGEPIYALFERVGKELSISGNLLDFGAGRGELGRRLRKIAHIKSVTCIDLLTKPDSLDSDILWDTADLNNKTPYNDKCFDVIAAAEIIEHLENPRAIMREWYRLTKPGGWILFSTPNNESFRSLLALAFRGHYQAFGENSYPAHITALLQKDMERIANETGLELLGFRYTHHGMIPKARRLSWQNASMGLLRGKRFSDNVLAVCRRP